MKPLVPLMVVSAGLCVAMTTVFAAGRGRYAAATVRSSSSTCAFLRPFSRSVSRRHGTSVFATPIDYAKSEISSNEVVVFSKSTCPFCTSTKELFGSMSVDAKIIELNEMDDGADVQ